MCTLFVLDRWRASVRGVFLCNSSAILCEMVGAPVGEYKK